MGKVKQMLEEDMERNPDLYNGWIDYEFWLTCREEGLAEREAKVIIKNKEQNERTNIQKKSNKK